MNTKELAALLDGREYTKEIITEEAMLADAHGLVVVYGFNSDTVQLRGEIYYEVCLLANGNTIHLTRRGLLLKDGNNFTSPFNRALSVDLSATIIANYNEDAECPWTFTTRIPHEKFQILKEGALFCEGMVFALANIFGANT